MLAVKQYLWSYDVYDVIDILKGFLRQKSDLQRIEHPAVCICFASPFEIYIEVTRQKMIS